MFDELEKFTLNGHFIYEPTQKLTETCNAPDNKSGVYLVYALSKGSVELIYIGCSGKRNADGSIFIRKAGLGGLKDRIVNGHQFGKNPRRVSWPAQLLIENIEALDIYWYVTHDLNLQECPRALERNLLEKYINLKGKLPRWNKMI